MWLKDLNLESLLVQDRIIQKRLQNEGTNGDWFLSCFYGLTYYEDKNALWNILHQIKSKMTDPWVADFIALLYSNDKQGGHLVGNSSDMAFSEIV